MKRYWYLTVLAMILVILPTEVIAAGKKPSANDFMKGKMWPQAIAILEKEIVSNPTNADAHFNLGICYLNFIYKYNEMQADDRFASAVALKPSYGLKIGDYFYQTGMENLKKGQTVIAKKLFQKAVVYQPKLSSSICEETFTAGNAAYEQQKPAYYEITRMFCDKHNAEIGQKLISIANKQTTVEGREMYLREASNFIILEELEKVPEESLGWKVEDTNLVANLEPGQSSTRTFVLNEGESTPWIILPPLKYRLSTDWTKTIIIDNGKKRVLVNPEDDYNPGISSGEEVKRKYTALKNETQVIVTLKRLP